MGRIQNISAEDIKQNGGTLTLTIQDVTVEELSKLDGTNNTHPKIVLHFGLNSQKVFIANRTSLARLAAVEPDPKKWVGLTINIKTKSIAIPINPFAEDKNNPANIRYEDQKYIDSVEGATPYDLIDNLIQQLKS